MLLRESGFCFVLAWVVCRFIVNLFLARDAISIEFVNFVCNLFVSKPRVQVIA